MALSPYRMALLDTIAGTESPDYRTVYGGSKFGSYARHPGRYVTIRSGPNRGRKSSAAGRYQFLESTWREQANRLGLSDFSPGNQDLAAWDLANRAYGGDLEAALRSGDPRAIASAGNKLSGTWTSLPGGIERAKGGTSRFVNSFQKHLARRLGGAVGEQQQIGDPLTSTVIGSRTAGPAAAPVNMPLLTVKPPTLADRLGPKPSDRVRPQGSPAQNPVNLLQAFGHDLGGAGGALGGMRGK